jgi:hypothetical protein
MSHNLTKRADSRPIEVLDSRFDDILAIYIQQGDIVRRLHVLLLN